MDAPLPTDVGTPTLRAVAALADALAGRVPVHHPGTRVHAALSAPVNRALAPQPALVAAPRTPGEVVDAVRAARRHGVPVAVQGTGHGASSPLPGALLVSTAELDHLTVLPALGRAHVGAGVRWDAVLAAAAPYGLAPVCGSAPSVGVVGYLTGGGHGPLARTLGVSSDRVRAFDVVTGDGELRHASPTDEPDLFWGLRGGRGALGVVVAVEIDLVDLPTMYAGTLWFADVERTLPAWAAWAAALPAQATTSLAVVREPAGPGVPEVPADRPAAAVRVAWTGDPADGEAALAALRALGPLADTVGVVPGSAVGTIHADPLEHAPVHLSHLLLEDLAPDAAERLVGLVGRGSGCAQRIVEVRHLGGAASRQPEVPDAVPSRAATWSFVTVGAAQPAATRPAVVADADRLARGLAPWTRPGGLPNFTPGHGRAWAERVYPVPTRTRLAQLSRRYDPDGVLLAGHAFRTP